MERRIQRAGREEENARWQRRRNVQLKMENRNSVALMAGINDDVGIEPRGPTACLLCVAVFVNERVFTFHCTGR